MHLKMSSAKFRPFYSGVSVLNVKHWRERVDGRVRTLMAPVNLVPRKVIRCEQKRDITYTKGAS